MGWLDRLLGRTKQDEAQTRVLADMLGTIEANEPKDPAGRRVYNEYFIEYHGDDDHYHWHCRVYGPDGMRAEKRGLAITEDVARLQAMTYANKMKADIRAAL